MYFWEFPFRAFLSEGVLFESWLFVLYVRVSFLRVACDSVYASSGQIEIRKSPRPGITFREDMKTSLKWIEALQLEVETIEKSTQKRYQQKNLSEKKLAKVEMTNDLSVTSQEDMRNPLWEKKASRKDTSDTSTWVHDCTWVNLIEKNTSQEPTLDMIENTTLR